MTTLASSLRDRRWPVVSAVLPAVPVRARIREPAFWTVQLGILAVTAFHGAAEGFDLPEGGLGTALVDVSVVLYLLPVVYAGLRYGMEGGVLTALWASLLSLPNLLIWHGNGYEWLGELLVLLFVVGLGASVSVPVERERQERARAQAASRRLALLNDVADLLMRPSPLPMRLRAVSDRLASDLDLNGVAIVTKQEPDTTLVHACCGDEARWPQAAVMALPHHAATAPRWQVVGDTAAFPVALRMGGLAYLLARPRDGQQLRHADAEVLGAVTGQLALALDNSRLHEAERERLRSYGRGVTLAHEHERTRIARDLHDVATHELLLLCQEIDAVLDDTNCAHAEFLEELRGRTTGVVDYLRRFARDLRPSMLDHLGVVPAIDWLVSRLTDRTGLEIRLRVQGDPRRLESDTEIAVFRIVEEALRNVDEHAEATAVDVVVEFSDAAMQVTVTDDGVGIALDDTDNPTDGGGLGLLGMQERAQLAGGAVAIVPGDDRGTTVSVTIPLTAS